MDKILFPFVFVWPVLVHCSPVKWFFIIVQRKLTKNYYVQCVYMYYCHLMLIIKKFPTKLRSFVVNTLKTALYSGRERLVYEKAKWKFKIIQIDGLNGIRSLVRQLDSPTAR